MSKPFRFKAFIVQQDQTAMKVGTDGVLLGAWTGIAHEPDSILDIGTGTGLIALMLAQRSSAGLIDAVEIEQDAFEQAVQNFENSPWPDRLYCYHASFIDFVEEMKDEMKYDLILSNPPFFQEGQTSGDLRRDIARYRASMNFPELLSGSSRLLAEYGRISLILPFSLEQEVLELALEQSLFPQRITRVKGTPDSPVKRVLLELGRRRNAPLVDQLILETSRHQYTEECRHLLKDFYLNF